jgi:cytoskeleton protein RodZ
MMGVNDLTVLGGFRVESFGARLKREREQQGMELEGVAAATKIGVRMLQALEEERFGQLPGGIFNKGFVRAYSRHLGLDEEQAIADYLVAAGGPTPGKEPEAVLADLAARAVEVRPESEPRRSGDIPWGKLSVLLLMVAVAFALWSARSRGSRSSQEVSPADAPAVTAPASASVPVPAEGPDASHASAQPVGGPTSTESARSASSEQSSPGAGATVLPHAADQAQSPAVNGSFVVQIQVREDSWLAITGDGKPVLHDLVPAGSEKEVNAHREIVVKAGNVAGLGFFFNGKPVSVEGRRDQVKTIRFDANGLESPGANSTR